MAIAACRRSGMFERVGLTRAEYLSTTAMVLAAAVLVARRWAGALTVAPTLGAAAAFAFVFGGLTAAAIVIGRKSGNSACRGCRVAIVMATVMAAAALTLPRTSAAALLLVWSPAAAACGIVAVMLARRPFPRLVQIGRHWGTTLTTAAIGQSASDETVEPFARGLLPEDSCRPMLSVVRYFDAEGRDAARGEAQAPFDAGQRHVAIHLAFCPPFALVPQLRAECVDVPEARAVVAQVLPYAARIEVKLSEPAEEPLDVKVAFQAVQ